FGVPIRSGGVRGIQFYCVGLNSQLPRYPFRGASVVRQFNGVATWRQLVGQRESSLALDRICILSLRASGTTQRIQFGGEGLSLLKLSNYRHNLTWTHSVRQTVGFANDSGAQIHRPREDNGNEQHAKNLHSLEIH